MKRLIELSLIGVILLGATACTIRHSVEQDYPQYLANNAGQANLPTTDQASAYLLTPATQQFSYEFRSAMAGYAHLWVVDFGKMLDDTMRSAEVQNAFNAIRKVADVSAASDGLLVFDLQRYAFQDCGAQISLKVSFYRSGQVAFSKTYTQHGKTQGGKMFWGGVFAQKNAVQQSTKLALDAILRQLIYDLEQAGA